VLCHKHGIASKFIKPYLDKPQLPIKGDAESFQSTQLSNMTQRELIQALNNDAFKLGVYSNTGLGIRCSGGHSALVFHEQVISNGIKNSLRERPTILGAIARKNQEYKTWSFSRIVLGGPLDKSSFYICVFRRDGQLMFYGVGKHDENMVELSSVDQPGCFAVRANVYWHENKVVIAGISTLKKTQARVAEVYNLSQAKSTIL
jgi:hypothetical protein